MRLTVLYFAALRDLVGMSEEHLLVDETDVSVASLKQLLEHRHERLRGVLDPVRFAVNEEFEGAAARLKDGDTVALIPPVQGG